MALPSPASIAWSTSRERIIGRTRYDDLFFLFCLLSFYVVVRWESCVSRVLARHRDPIVVIGAISRILQVIIADAHIFMGTREQ